MCISLIAGQLPWKLSCKSKRRTPQIDCIIRCICFLWWDKSVWLSFQVVLQLCHIEFMKSVWNVQASGNNKWIVWPVYSIICFIYWLCNAVFLENCMIKHYKCVHVLLYPKPITLICVINFHYMLSNCTFLCKTFILFFLKESSCQVKSLTSHISVLFNVSYIIIHDIGMHLYGTKMRYISITFLKHWWMIGNTITIWFFFTVLMK